jgi:hypothetical protein
MSKKLLANTWNRTEVRIAVLSDLFKMERAMKTALSHRREAYRLWFEYLRLAHRSSKPNMQAALKQSASFYAPWGNVVETKFDDWWKEHGHLFEDKYAVRRLKAGERPIDPQAIIVEIPLTQSKSVLIKRVAEIIGELPPAQQASMKSKKNPTAQFQLTAGAEPKLKAVREMLTVYRDVYLKNQNVRGKRLLDAVERHYLGRKDKRWAKIPKALNLDANANEKDIFDVLRNMRRYITKAERVMINVANGEFPGRY